MNFLCLAVLVQIVHATRASEVDLEQGGEHEIASVKEILRRTAIKQRQHENKALAREGVITRAECDRNNAKLEKELNGEPSEWECVIF